MFDNRRGKNRFTHNFCAAIKDGKLKAISSFLGDVEPSTVKDSANNNLLHLSAEHGDVRAVKYFLDANCQVNERNDLGFTPLIYAASRSNYQMMQALLKYGADFKIKSNDGRGALHFCRRFEDRKIFKLLAKAMRAEDLPAEEMSRMLLDANCPLYHSVFTRNIELVKIVCEKRGNVDETDDNGYSALHAAMYEGDVNLVTCLLELGADLKKSLSRSFPLHYAVRSVFKKGCCNGYYEVLEYLLRNGADINQQDENGKTLLHEAANAGNRRLVKLLLDNGADVEIKDNDNNGVLHFAAKRDDNKLLKLLVDTGRLNVNISNDRGSTPLHVATRFLSFDSTKFFLKHGASIDVVDADGCTPLHLLINWEPLNTLHKEAQRDSADLMLDYGAYSNRPNPSGKSILTCPFGKDLDHLLVQHIAKLEVFGHPISEENMLFINKSSQLSRYLKKCRKELEEMRLEKFYEQVSFLDVLDNIHTMSCYARNPELVQAFWTKNPVCFPIYHSMLVRSLENAKQRNNLLSKSAEKLKGVHLFGVTEVADRIFSYLGIHDLQNVCFPDKF